MKHLQLIWAAAFCLCNSAIAKPAESGLVITQFDPPMALAGKGLVLQSPRDFAISDWSMIEDAVLELESSEKRELHLSVTLRNETGDSEKALSAGFYVNMTPQAKIAWRLPIFPLQYTERWEFPLLKGFSWYGGWGHLDTAKIVQISIKLDEDDGKADLRLKMIRLEGKTNHHAWIDAWGQNSKGSWPGKVAKDEDLLAADKAEFEGYKKSAPSSNRDAYQGWTGAPARKASGFFRTEKIDGRWWLITPTGRLYFMTGIDCIGPGSHARNDDIVRDAYSWLPPKEGPFAAAWMHIGGKEEAFAMYRANLIRKWGKNFEEEWYKRMPLRMRAWGFSSIGNWSDDKVTASHVLPYVTMGPETWSKKLPYASKNLQDAFHPDFPAEAKRASTELATRYKDDPYLIGHFVGNEMDWKELPMRVLEKPESLPSRKRFVESLKKEHGTLEKVSAAWSVSATAWKDLRLPKDGKHWPEAATKDAAAFRGEFAELWFSTWGRELKLADPNHLFLGSRIHGGGNRSDEVISACGRYADVVSFNEYSLAPNRAEYDHWQALADRPFIIGEYTFNSLDDGLLASAVPVAGRIQRGVGYRFYTEQMAALPYFVGGHFFQFEDEPITGRGDRETSYNGFVRVTDIPDQNLIEAAAASNRLVEEIHAGRKKASSARPRRF